MDIPTITIPSRLWAVLCTQAKNDRNIYTLQITQSSAIYLQCPHRALAYTVIWPAVLSTNAVREETSISKSVSLSPSVGFTQLLRRSDYQDRSTENSEFQKKCRVSNCLVMSVFLWSPLTPMTFYYNKALLTSQCVLIMKDSEIHFSMEADFRKGSGCSVKEPGALLQQCNCRSSSHLSAASNPGFHGVMV